MIALDSISGSQPQKIIGPKIVIEQVRCGATRAVSGHAGFAAVRVENAHLKIRFGVRGRLDYRDAIRAGAIMAIERNASFVISFPSKRFIVFLSSSAAAVNCVSASSMLARRRFSKPSLSLIPLTSGA